MHQADLTGPLLELPDPVTADTPLEEALQALDGSQGTAVPVLDAAGVRLVGWLTHQTALAALRLGAANPR